MYSWYQNKEVEKFINANLQTDLHSLLLKKGGPEKISFFVERGNCFSTES